MQDAFAKLNDLLLLLFLFEIFWTKQSTCVWIGSVVLTCSIGLFFLYTRLCMHKTESMQFAKKYNNNIRSSQDRMKNNLCCDCSNTKYVCAAVFLLIVYVNGKRVWVVCHMGARIHNYAVYVYEISAVFTYRNGRIAWVCAHTQIFHCDMANIC